MDNLLKVAYKGAADALGSASSARCTITNVTTLLQSHRDALSLVQAAGTGLEAPSLKVAGVPTCPRHGKQGGCILQDNHGQELRRRTTPTHDAAGRSAIRR